MRNLHVKRLFDVFGDFIPAPKDLRKRERERERLFCKFLLDPSARLFLDEVTCTELSKYF